MGVSKLSAKVFSKVNYSFNQFCLAHFISTANGGVFRVSLFHRYQSCLQNTPLFSPILD